MGVADPDRLGVEGTSNGGYATVLLLTQTDRSALYRTMSPISLVAVALPSVAVARTR